MCVCVRHMRGRWRTCERRFQAFACVFINTYIYISPSPCVWVCVSAKCHIDRLIAAVSDSVTLWLVDSSLIHTPSWVIGPAHWFPACQPSQEELRGRKRACRYWLAPDQPHHLHHLPITRTHTHQTHPQSYSVQLYRAFSVSPLLPSSLSLFSSVPLGILVSCCSVIYINPVKYFYWQTSQGVGGI